ncbi:hypothetical protein RHIZO_01814 [Rhizobiaceae bacterium]|nr:hypothetical protein RHIZO_01814 [Rhizobiaceae bacterium]
MTTYVLAFYEIDRAYGGPEEGGWWYDTGRLVRILAHVQNRRKGLRCRLPREPAVGAPATEQAGCRIDYL